MSGTRKSAEEVHARLDHPIIDADGHMIESVPVLTDYLQRTLGSEAWSRMSREPAWRLTFGSDSWASTSEAERREGWMLAAPWWGVPTRTRDRATALLPGLFADRLDELGVDFTIVYPTLCNFALGLADDELRRGASRAFNTFLADAVRDHADRMTCPALIPMHSPEEALAELNHATEILGMRCIVISGYVRRSLPDSGAGTDRAGGSAREYFDVFGIDSDYDYDPFWARCQELGVAVTTHSGSQGLGFRQSPTRYMYNHVGHFAAAHEALAKALIFGGVTKRFPDLNFGFLEGGAGWAAMLYSDLFEHWEKRGGSNIHQLDPARVDWREMDELLATHGGSRFEDPALLEALRQHQTGRPPELDDFAQSGIERREDIKDLFVPRFFFGCEADDRSAAWAFADRYHAYGARFQAMLGSDFGHWDVPDMREVIPEAYELVEQELMSSTDFRDFACDNVLRLHAGMNPDFFAGTRVETYAKDFLARRPGSD
jgi:predicted TIM-barrel fold metal-dependent hydrolase